MQEINDLIKLVIPAHEAKPIPSIFIPLYNAEIDVIEFCNRFNEETKYMNGDIRIGIIVYKDLTYDILSPEDLEKIEQLPPINYDISEKEYNLLKKIEHKLK